MTVLDRLPPGLRKLFLYALCGGSGVALDLATYSLLVGGGVWYQVANVVGYALGTCLSFVLNRAITFGVKDAPVRRFFSFISVAAFGYLVSTSLLWAMVDLMQVDPIFAKALTLLAVLAVQFSLNSLITFRTAATHSSSESTCP
jgi:putative flippase GtrA